MSREVGVDQRTGVNWGDIFKEGLQETAKGAVTGAGNYLENKWGQSANKPGTDAFGRREEAKDKANQWKNSFEPF